jgi:hypothetical protein
MKGGKGMWSDGAQLRIDAPDAWKSVTTKIKNYWEVNLTAPTGAPPGKYQIFFDIRENGRSKYIWRKIIRVIPPMKLLRSIVKNNLSGQQVVSLLLKKNKKSINEFNIKIIENEKIKLGEGKSSSENVTIPISTPSFGRKSTYQAVFSLPDEYQWIEPIDDIALIRVGHTTVDLNNTLDSWPKNSVYNLADGLYSKHAVKGKNDRTQGQLYIAWDNKHLYIGAQIKDKYFRPSKIPSSLWAGDSLQIGISVAPKFMIRPNNDGIQETSYAEFGVIPKKGDNSWVWASMNRSKMELRQPVPGLLNESERNGDHTIYKIAIPWDSLNVKTPKIGMEFKLSVLVNDRDIGNRHWLEWYSGIASGKNPALYGKGLLYK